MNNQTDQSADHMTTHTTIPSAPIQTGRYNGWLISSSFVKRALAVTGYAIVGQFIVYGLLLMLFIALAGVAAVFN